MKVECLGTKYLVLLVCLFERAYTLDSVSRKITIPLRKYRDTNRTTEKRDVIEADNTDISPSYHDNLSGRPGQGYYLAIQIGTPPQSVSSCIKLQNIKMLNNLMKCILGLSKCLRFFSILRVL